MRPPAGPNERGMLGRVKGPTREQFAHMRRELWNWDLIGIGDDPSAPSDEYDCLIPDLWNAVHATEPMSERVSCLAAHVEDHFGLTPDIAQIEALVARSTAQVEQASQ